MLEHMSVLTCSVGVFLFVCVIFHPKRGGMW